MTRCCCLWPPLQARRQGGPTRAHLLPFSRHSTPAATPAGCAGGRPLGPCAGCLPAGPPCSRSRSGEHPVTRRPLAPLAPALGHKSPGNKVVTDTPNCAPCDARWTGPPFLDVSDGLGLQRPVRPPHRGACGSLGVRCLSRAVPITIGCDKYFVFQASSSSFSQQPRGK